MTGADTKEVYWAQLTPVGEIFRINKLLNKFMKRKILAIVVGILPPLVMGIFLSLNILKPPWTGLEAILAIGFVGSFLTGIIVREKGWCYGQIPVLFWYVYFNVLASIRASIRAGT